MIWFDEDFKVGFMICMKDWMHRWTSPLMEISACSWPAQAKLSQFLADSNIFFVFIVQNVVNCLSSTYRLSAMTCIEHDDLVSPRAHGKTQVTMMELFRRWIAKDKRTSRTKTIYEDIYRFSRTTNHQTTPHGKTYVKSLVIVITTVNIFQIQILIFSLDENPAIQTQAIKIHLNYLKIMWSGT